jgi:hypothetical protein
VPVSPQKGTDDLPAGRMLPVQPRAVGSGDQQPAPALGVVIDNETGNEARPGTGDRRTVSNAIPDSDHQGAQAAADQRETDLSIEPGPLSRLDGIGTSPEDDPSTISWAYRQPDLGTLRLVVCGPRHSRRSDWSKCGECPSIRPAMGTSPSAICLAEHRVEFRVGPELPDLLRAAAGHGDLGSPLQRLLA